MSGYVEPLISAERVEAIIKDCLFKDDELPEGAPDDEWLANAGAVIADGILNPFAFHPQRLESHRLEVTQMLRDLPLPFRSQAVGGGGGWSFLNACQDANDVQWTGLHRTMDHLFCLGIALGLAAWALPRDTWPILPGGMPYVVVKV